MNFKKTMSLLIGCLVLCSDGAAVRAFAQEDAVTDAILSSVTAQAASVYQPLKSKPDSSGLVQFEDGTASYISDGKKLTGLFSVTPEYTKGDLGNNGTVDASDATLILIASAEAAAENQSASALLADSVASLENDYQAMQVADVNNDGSVDAGDATEVLIYAAQLGAGEAEHPLGYAVYFADADGVLQNGWIQDGEQRYYGNDNYTLRCGWNEIDGQRYYFSQNGQLVNTGLTEIAGKKYYFDQTALFLTNTWVDLKDGMYYFGEDGVMQTGLQKIGAHYYDLGTDGAMQTGLIVSEEGKRLASETGAVTLGWYTEDESTFYFNEDTGYMATGWYDVDGKTYYFGEDGVMATGTQEIDGKVCRFSANGVYNQVKICIDAGHYAKYNHSPVNSAYWESDFTWKHHLYLVDSLEAYGIEVITTREDKDTDMDLEDRGRCSEGCDLFLSVHSNACNDSSVDGPLACCAIDGSADVLGQKLADTVADVMQTRQGGTIWKRHGVKFPNLDYYGVLRGATEVGTPGILLEHSYHTNYRATVWLMNDTNLQTMADAEAKVIAEYFGIAE